MNILIQAVKKIYTYFFTYEKNYYSHDALHRSYHDLPKQFININRYVYMYMYNNNDHINAFTDTIKVKHTQS